MQDKEMDKLSIKSQNLEHFHGHGISNFSEFKVIFLCPAFQSMTCNPVENTGGNWFWTRILNQ